MTQNSTIRMVQAAGRLRTGVLVASFACDFLAVAAQKFLNCRIATESGQGKRDKLDLIASNPSRILYIQTSVPRISWPS